MKKYLVKKYNLDINSICKMQFYVFDAGEKCFSPAFLLGRYYE